jgi:tetratricopeptide (TPR) repeat protein
MKKANLVLMAALASAGLVTTTGALLLPTQAAYAKEKEKEKAPEQTVGAAVGKPLKAARDALMAKDLDLALQQIQLAQAVEPKTPFEQFMIDDTAYFIYLQRKDFPAAAASLERSVAAGFLSEADKPRRLRDLTVLLAQSKQYDKALQYGTEYLKLNPGDQQVAVELARLRLLNKDYAGAKAGAEQVIGAMPKPPEAAFIVAYNANRALKDTAGVTRALEGLVRSYPQPKYWHDAISDYIYRTKDDRALRGLYRLMLDTESLQTGDQYAETGTLLVSGGFPTEAKAVLEKGMTANVFEGERRARAQADLDQARSLAATDAKDVPGAAAKLAAARTANEMVGIGKLYFSMGDYEKAVDAFQKGLAKGGVTDANDANLLLGIANARLGKTDPARAALGAVTDPVLSPVAKLWLIRLDSLANATAPAAATTG